MPTTMTINIRAEAPYFVLENNDSGVAVSTTPGVFVYSTGTGVANPREYVISSLASYRGSILSDLASGRQYILDELSQMRGDILSDTTGLNILGDLEAARTSILMSLSTTRSDIINDISGSNAGPILVLANVEVDTSRYEVVLAQAERTTEATLKRELTTLAGLELTYATAIAAAQQIVQDAVMAGADWIMGDYAYVAAKISRGIMADNAARAYNAGLPLAFLSLTKELGTMGA